MSTILLAQANALNRDMLPCRLERKGHTIAPTAHAMEGDERRAREAGCDDDDTKPVELPRLLAKMEARLGS